MRDRYGKKNVMRILDKEHIKYQAYDYTKLNVISGMDVAASLGEDFNHVFKTLVTVPNLETIMFLSCP